MLVRACLMLVTLLVAGPAYAQDRWVQETIDCRGCAKQQHQYRPARYQRPSSHHYRSPQRYEVSECRPEVDVVSTEHTQAEHAREAAQKLWMAKTQWRWGGRFMDLDQAREVRWACGPSNAHDTFTSKLVEGATKLVGGDGQNVRCALTARPCVQRENDGKGDRQ
jgi:hypothetical protein